MSLNEVSCCERWSFTPPWFYSESRQEAEKGEELADHTTRFPDCELHTFSLKCGAAKQFSRRRYTHHCELSGGGDLICTCQRRRRSIKQKLGKRINAEAYKNILFMISPHCYGRWFDLEMFIHVRLWKAEKCLAHPQPSGSLKSLPAVSIKPHTFIFAYTQAYLSRQDHRVPKSLEVIRCLMACQFFAWQEVIFMSFA